MKNPPKTPDTNIFPEEVYGNHVKGWDGDWKSCYKEGQKAEHQRILEVLIEARNDYLFVHRCERCYFIEKIMQELGFNIDGLNIGYVPEEELKKELKKEVEK